MYSKRRLRPRGVLRLEQLERRDCPATVSISGGREVTEGTAGIALQVTLSEPLTTKASVVLSTAGSTATSADYSLAPYLPRGVLVFQPGETSKTLTLSTRQDVLREPTERVLISLTRPTNCTVGTTSATVRILDDDSYSVSMMGPVSSVSAGQLADISIQLSAPATKNESFWLTTINGSAKARTDFTPLSRRLLTVPLGATSAKLQIPILASGTTPKTFVVGAVSATRGTPSPSPLGVTIKTALPPPILTVANTSLAEGNPGSTNTAVFTLSLSAACPNAVSVSYQTADGSANSQDYTVRSGIVTFAPGQTVMPVNIPVTGDSVFEANESFSLVLAAPSNCTLGNSSATANILNDDSLPAPSISIANTSVNEGNAASTLANFTVSLSVSSSQAITVNYSTVAETATSNDFTAAYGTLAFAPGETSKVISIVVSGDTEFEPNETFRVVLSGAIGATLGTGEGVGTILNDDPSPIPNISIANTSVLEGNSGTTAASFILTLSFASSSTITVNYATANGTATTADGDYSPQSGTVTFAPGDLQRVITVAVAGDTKPENEETFAVNLFSPLNATLLRTQAIVTVRNDDAAPSLGSWTIMVYMTGDTLNRYAADDINEMERSLAKLPSSVSIVVSWDQPAVTANGTTSVYSTGNGSQRAWNAYGRSKLIPDRNNYGNTGFESILSTFEIFSGDKNTGDPSTLSDFMKWGAQQAPAERYLLMMWGHGGGLLGSNFDYEAGGDGLSISEMATALSAPGVPTFDIVGYDNCLMGMVEVAYALSPDVPGFFVGSEETIPGYGHDYTTVFNTLQSNPRTVSSETVARGIVTSFETQRSQMLQKWEIISDPAAWQLTWNSTYSAIRSSSLGLLASSVRELVANSENLTSLDWMTVRAWANPVHAYGGKTFVDLGQFLFYVSNASQLPSSFRASASLAFNALDYAVVQRSADPYNSTGLAIYLRSDGYFDYRYAYDAPEFISATNWAQFIYWLSYPATPT